MSPLILMKSEKKLLEKFDFDKVNMRIFLVMRFIAKFMMTTALIFSIIMMFHVLTAMFISRTWERKFYSE